MVKYYMTPPGLIHKEKIVALWRKW